MPPWFVGAVDYLISTVMFAAQQHSVQRVQCVMTAICFRWSRPLAHFVHMGNVLGVCCAVMFAAPWLMFALMPIPIAVRVPVLALGESLAFRVIGAGFEIGECGEMRQGKT